MNFMGESVAPDRFRFGAAVCLLTKVLVSIGRCITRRAVRDPNFECQ